MCLLETYREFFSDFIYTAINRNNFSISLLNVLLLSLSCPAHYYLLSVFSYKMYKPVIDTTVYTENKYQIFCDILSLWVRH